MTLVTDGVKLIRLRFQTTTRQRKGSGGQAPWHLGLLLVAFELKLKLKWRTVL